MAVSPERAAIVVEKAEFVDRCIGILAERQSVTFEEYVEHVERGYVNALRSSGFDVCWQDEGHPSTGDRVEWWQMDGDGGVDEVAVVAAESGPTVSILAVRSIPLGWSSDGSADTCHNFLSHRGQT